MITFLPPPDGVPIDPIAHPYAIEKSNKLDNRVDLSRGKPAFRINESATGSIIAATVCSPIKEDRIAEIEINPNHPNLTIWHNKIDTCMFVGVHCHQANLSLKIIRGGTYCYTIAMCAQAGHEDAMLSFRDATADKIMKLADWVKKLKGSVEPPSKDHPFQ